MAAAGVGTAEPLRGMRPLNMGTAREFARFSGLICFICSVVLRIFDRTRYWL
jgi:hypothetical protein